MRGILPWFSASHHLLPHTQCAARCVHEPVAGGCAVCCANAGGDLTVPRLAQERAPWAHKGLISSLQRQVQEHAGRAGRRTPLR